MIGGFYVLGNFCELEMSWMKVANEGMGRREVAANHHSGAVLTFNLCLF